MLVSNKIKLKYKKRKEEKMKKLIKLTKVFLVLVTVFSQLSGVVTVLADEITSLPLTTTLNKVSDEKYVVTLDGEDYENNTTYNVVLTPSFKYLDGTEDTKADVTLSKLGSEINASINVEVDAISDDYNGLYSLDVKVKKGASEVYSTTLTNAIVDNKAGLTGYLNTDIYENEDGYYELTSEGTYQLHLKVNVGNLNPNSNYKLVYGGVETSALLASDLKNIVIDGDSLDLTGKLSGQYVIEYSNVKVVEVTTDGENEVADYSYTANILYSNGEKDNDTILNDSFSDINVELEDGYARVYANGIYDKKVPTVGEVLEKVTTPLEIEVKNEMGEVLDVTSEEVLSSEVKTGYTLDFVNGATAHYTVLVIGDADSNNKFDDEDIKLAMKAMLEEDNILTMNSSGNSILTLEDIMLFNKVKHSESIDELYIEESDNTGLTIELGSTPLEVELGKTFDVDVILNNPLTLETQLSDYIDGMFGSVTTLGSLKLTDIKVKDNYLSYLEDNEFVLAGPKLTTDKDVIVTLTFMAVSEGIDAITLSGKIAKYNNIKEFDALTSDDITVFRPISTNNNLSSLNSDKGTFDITFDKDVVVYTLTVPYDTEKVILSGGLEDIHATVEGLVEYELKENTTVATIVVTAEDGSIKTYTVNIVKEEKPATPIVYYYSDNNYLKSLEIEDYEIDFDKNKLSYELTVENKNSLEIKAIPEDARSRVEITGNENFKEGKNVVVITVFAENGSTREYKVIVNKVKTSELTEIDEASNTAEKIVIIVLIVLVVLGLLYLIFKKDEQEIPEVIVNDNKQKTKNNKISKKK